MTTKNASLDWEEKKEKSRECLLDYLDRRGNLNPISNATSSVKKTFRLDGRTPPMVTVMSIWSPTSVTNIDVAPPIRRVLIWKVEHQRN